jgi:hypothetical protein
MTKKLADIGKLKLGKDTLRCLVSEPVRRAGAGPEGHGSWLLSTNCNTRSCG